MLPHAGMPCIPVFGDNQGVKKLAQNPVTNSKSKHIDVRHHFLKEMVGRKEVSIAHLPTLFQRADFIPKELPRESFEFHLCLAMNVWWTYAVGAGMLLWIPDVRFFAIKGGE